MRERERGVSRFKHEPLFCTAHPVIVFPLLKEGPRDRSSVCVSKTRRCTFFSDRCNAAAMLPLASSKKKSTTRRYPRCSTMRLREAGLRGVGDPWRRTKKGGGINYSQKTTANMTTIACPRERRRARPHWRVEGRDDPVQARREGASFSQARCRFASTTDDVVANFEGSDVVTFDVSNLLSTGCKKHPSLNG